MKARVLLVLLALAAALAGLAAWLAGAPPQPAVEGAATFAAEGRAAAVELEDAPPARATRSETADDSASAATLSVRVVDPSGAALDAWQVYVEELRPPVDADPLAPCPEVVPGEVLAAPRARTHVLESRGASPVPIPARLMESGRCLLLRALAQHAGPPPRFVESDPWIVDTAQRGTVDLVVHPPTLLVVRLAGARPSGDLDYELTRIGGTASRGAPSADRRRTLDSPVTFRIVPGEAYVIRVGAGSEDTVESHVSPVSRGRTAEVELTFPRGLLDPVPDDYAEVALTGEVVAGCGDAGLWAVVDGGAPITIPTQPDGRFELVARRGKAVELHAAGGELEARFDPEVSTHAFGTRDVVVRCVPPAPRVEVEITVVSAAPDARLDDVWFQLLRRDGDRVRTKTLGSRARNTFRAVVPVLADLECVVYASGHRDAAEYLFPAGAPRGAVVDGGLAAPLVLRTISLEPGFRRTFRTVHCSEHTPVAGATLSLDGRLLGVTDARGEMIVELPEWPGRIVVEAAGFDVREWPPKWQTPVPATTVRLCPID